jgi:hypothetical protein
MYWGLELPSHVLQLPPCSAALWPAHLRLSNFTHAMRGNSLPALKHLSSWKSKPFTKRPCGANLSLALQASLSRLHTAVPGRLWKSSLVQYLSVHVCIAYLHRCPKLAIDQPHAHQPLSCIDCAAAGGRPKICLSHSIINSADSPAGLYSKLWGQNPAAVCQPAAGKVPLAKAWRYTAALCPE